MNDSDKTNVNWNRVKTPWNGWHWYDDLYLVDPSGNRYSPEMIQSALWTSELAHELTGSSLQIRVLRDELRKRLAIPPPQIVVRWNNQESIVEIPWKSNSSMPL